MTLLEVFQFIAILWLFCSVIAAYATWILLRELEHPRGLFERSAAVLISIIAGLLFGPFLIGEFLGVSAVESHTNTKVTFPTPSG